MTRWIKPVLYAIVGACAGFAYYYYVGCLSGSCPLSSNPYISTAYGALVGTILSMNGKSKNKES